MSVKPIPDGYHSVTPYLIVKGAAKAIEFYKAAFGAVPTMELVRPDNDEIMHAEFQVGDSRVMIADEFPEMNALAPQPDGGTSVSICMYVENVDETVEAAAKAGATIVRPVEDQFYGDRSATLLDPFGHTWTVATHIEDLTPDEIQKRMAEMMGG